MGAIVKIKTIITLLLIVAAAGVAYLGKDILDAGVTDYRVESIHSIDASGFTVDMILSVTNPTKLDLRADRITYTAILRDTGEVVASGTLEGVSMPKNSSTDLEVSPRIRWVPTANLLAKYASQEEVWMDIELDVYIFGFLPGASATVPVDIKEAIDEWDITDVTSSVTGNDGNIVTDLFG